MPETIGELLDRLTATAEAKLPNAPEHDREALHATLAVFQAVRLGVDSHKVLNAADLLALQDLDLATDDHGFDVVATTAQLTKILNGS